MRRRALTSLFVFLLALALGCCIFLSACDGAGENDGQNNGGQNNEEGTNEELPVTEEGLAQFFSAMEAAENSAEVTVTIAVGTTGRRKSPFPLRRTVCAFITPRAISGRTGRTRIPMRTLRSGRARTSIHGRTSSATRTAMTTT